MVTESNIQYKNINELSSPQITDFFSLVAEYLPGSSQQIILSRIKDFGSSYICALDGRQIIGVCFGWPRKLDAPEDTSFTLDGLAVTARYARKGIGKILLKKFEDSVQMQNYPSISVGSADGYVEDFYLSAGFIPTEYKIWQKDKCIPIKQFKDFVDYKNYTRPANEDGFVVMEKKLGNNLSTDLSR